MKYDVYANTRHDSEHRGLIAACAHARSEAVARPGTLVAVHREGKQLYKAQVSGGRLEARWL